MSQPAPDITVDVDLRNPGQVFACCGLLELAGRKWKATADKGWREPEGWFAREGGRASFNIATGSGSNDPLGELVRELCGAEELVRLADDADEYSAGLQPVMLRPFALRLDWWLENYRPKWEKSELKVWAGRVTPKDNLTTLGNDWQKLIDVEKGADRHLFSARTPSSGVGVDPATSWTAINVGFSPDAQGIGVLTAPATEVLAMIGLQRCRPEIDMTQSRRWFSYHAWAEPASIAVAPAALAGIGRSVGAFTFPVEMRNAQYGNFGWAKPLEG